MLFRSASAAVKGNAAAKSVTYLQYANTSAPSTPPSSATNLHASSSSTMLSRMHHSMLSQERGEGRREEGAMGEEYPNCTTIS
jgi:hypothetical protein